MQVAKPKKGYKLVKTSFGKYEEIPEEWEVLELRKLCKVRQGLQIPISDRFSESGVNRLPYITVKSIHSGKFDDFIENPKKRVICNENDILVTRTGNTGEIITNIKGVFHRFVKVARADHSTSPELSIIHFQRVRYYQPLLVCDFCIVR